MFFTQNDEVVPVSSVFTVEWILKKFGIGRGIERMWSLERPTTVNWHVRKQESYTVFRVL